jgi:hypothetical protein
MTEGGGTFSGIFSASFTALSIPSAISYVFSYPSYKPPLRNEKPQRELARVV